MYKSKFSIDGDEDPENIVCMVSEEMRHKERIVKV